MSEVRLPLLRGAHVPRTHHPSPTANMAAQRGQAFLREDGEEDRIDIGQQVDEIAGTCALAKSEQSRRQ